MGLAGLEPAASWVRFRSPQRTLAGPNLKVCYVRSIEDGSGVSAPLPSL
jgi:hypothetical protein